MNRRVGSHARRRGRKNLLRSEPFEATTDVGSIRHLGVNLGYVGLPDDDAGLGAWALGRMLVGIWL